jgi:hypothetical protein
MESIDIVGMFKTVATVRPLGDNRFLVKYGNHQEAVVTIEAAQPSAQPMTDTICPKCGGWLKGGECENCILP